MSEKVIQRVIVCDRCPRRCSTDPKVEACGGNYMTERELAACITSFELDNLREFSRRKPRKS